jgi:hypothetical protein
MPQFTFELEAPPGIDSDNTGFAAKGRWMDANNVRFRLGRPETLGRIVQILASGDLAPDACGMHGYTIGTDPSPMVIVGTSTALFAGESSGLSAITPAGLGAGVRHWAFDNWGDTLLAAPKGGTLYEWAGTGVATEVTQAPDQMNCMLVARRYVIAIGCNEEVSGTFNPRCIRWCDFEDYTDWTSTADNNAGEHIVDGASVLVAAHVMGEYIAVWSNSSLYVGTYVGEPDQTWRFDKVADNCGLVGPAAKAVAGSIAYWMTPEHHFMRWAVGGPVEQIPCPILTELRANMVVTSKADQRTAAVTNSFFSEVWWFYPDGRASGANRYVMLNTLDGSWSRGDLDRRAACELSFFYYPGTSPTFRPWRPMLAVGGDGKVYSHDVEDAGGGIAVTMAAHLQSAEQYIESGRRRVMVRDIVPDFELQTGNVDLTIYERAHPRSAAYADGPHVIAADDDRVCLRASGKLLSVKFSSASGRWRLGKPTFDCVTLGER